MGEATQASPVHHRVPRADLPGRRFADHRRTAEASTQKRARSG